MRRDDDVVGVSVERSGACACACARVLVKAVNQPQARAGDAAGPRLSERPHSGIGADRRRSAPPWRRRALAVKRSTVAISHNAHVTRRPPLAPLHSHLALYIARLLESPRLFSLLSLLNRAAHNLFTAARRVLCTRNCINSHINGCWSLPTRCVERATDRKEYCMRGGCMREPLAPIDIYIRTCT